jgi:type I restriction enzyme S subunit
MTALTRARDELIPLLMSGKLRVRDAEKVVEAVV